jgi:hypothetical protein
VVLKLPESPEQLAVAHLTVAVLLAERWFVAVRRPEQLER